MFYIFLNVLYDTKNVSSRTCLAQKNSYIGDPRPQCNILVDLLTKLSRVLFRLIYLFHGSGVDSRVNIPEP